MGPVLARGKLRGMENAKWPRPPEFDFLENIAPAQGLPPKEKLVLLPQHE